eukprot:g4681.t1
MKSVKGKRRRRVSVKGGKRGPGWNKGVSIMLPLRESRDFVRRLKLTSHKEWQEWSKSGQRPSNVPAAPDQVYKGKGWVSYPDWMGYQYTKGDQMRKKMLPFEEARAVARNQNLTSKQEWQKWSKSGQRPSNVPSHPDRVYKGKGWVSYPDWMGYIPKDMKVIGEQMLPFEKARAVAQKQNLTSHKEWKEWSKSGQRPSNVPSGPYRVYKGKGWVSWPDWMGYMPKDMKAIGEQMLPFEKAREVVRALRLTGNKEWQEWSKSGQRPSNVPSRPDLVYKGKGWASWPDWMGYTPQKPGPKPKRKRKRAQQSESSSSSTPSSSSSSSSSSPPLENCVICFESLCPVTTEIGYLSCVHTFHVDCLNGHARASSTPATTSRRGVLINCPLCRKRSRWLPPPPT